MRLLLCSLWLLSCLVACKKSEVKPSAEKGLSAQAALVKPTLQHGLPWYLDAPDAALALAKAERKLVLVDLWAAWCHTCLSMREFVLTDKQLAGVQSQLVFLALDTEKAENAPWLKRYPIAAWPTFYLLDGSGQVYGRWIGAASPAQLVQFVKDGLRARETQQGGKLKEGDPLSLAIEGDRLALAGRLPEARDHYQRALAVAPPDWPRRPDTLLALANTLRQSQQVHLCVDLGETSLAQLGQTATATDFISNVLGCAEGLDPKDPRIEPLRLASEKRASALCFEQQPEMTPDDRGDACGLLHALRKRLGDPAGAKQALEQRLRILEAAAEGVPDAVALTYDAARVESLVALERAADGVKLLEQRERALPSESAPPHQLALLYGDLGRYAEGLSAIQRALAKAAGPRRAAMLGTKAELMIATGHREAARKILDEQLAAYRALPDGQKQPAREKALETRLALWE